MSLIRAGIRAVAGQFALLIAHFELIHDSGFGLAAAGSEQAVERNPEAVAVGVWYVLQYYSCGIAESEENDVGGRPGPVQNCAEKEKSTQALWF